MARRARCGRRRHMSADKGKTGRAMVKFSVGPGRDGMARRTRGGCRWESSCDVIRNIAAKSRRALPR